MSDPVSNAEIEDVLSSIRRLVSVDNKVDRTVSAKDPATVEREIARGNVRQDLGEEKKDEASEDGARLMLTPSLRIDAEPEAAKPTPSEPSTDAENGSLTLGQWQIARPEPEDAAPPADETPSDAEDETEAMVLAAEVADDGAQSGESWDAEDIPMDEARAQEWLEIKDEDPAELAEESTPDTVEQDDELASATVRIEDVLEKSDMGFDFAESEPADEPQAYETDAEDEDAPASELEARIAEVEAAVAARQDQWEPDGDDQDDYAGGPTQPLPWEDHVDEPDNEVSVESAAAVSEPQAEPEMEPELYPEPDPQPEVTFSSHLSRQQDVQAEPETEPSAASQEDATPTTAPDPKAATAQQDTGWYSEDAVLDEEALRDLVSEIVRQELQGTLGERITRNVRKLVRREIHRAMLGQDFD